MSKLLVAPFDLHSRLLGLIAREAENARKGLPARIVAKLNSLADRLVIEALYRASQAGVEIELIVRGICCLRPGLPGVSERITVRSIVDRFLEHSRVYYFENACQPEVFIGSADWLPRNFFRRIELVFPVVDGVLRERVTKEILATTLGDTVKARFLRPAGSYSRTRNKAPTPGIRSQFDFIAIAEGKTETSQKRDGKKSRYPAVKLRSKPTILGRAKRRRA